MALPACRGEAPKRFAVFLKTQEFVDALCVVPTVPAFPGVTPDPPVTLSTLYAFGRAPVYDAATQCACGTCSATFLCQQTSDIFADISNYLALDSGLIVSWFTPDRPADLAADTLVNGMVTQAIVQAATKVGSNPYFGASFSLTVSSGSGTISFEFQQLPRR